MTDTVFALGLAFAITRADVGALLVAAHDRVKDQLRVGPRNSVLFRRSS